MVRGHCHANPIRVPHDAERDTYLVLGDFWGDSVALGAKDRRRKS